MHNTMLTASILSSGIGIGGRRSVSMLFRLAHAYVPYQADGATNQKAWVYARMLDVIYKICWTEQWSFFGVCTHAAIQNRDRGTVYVAILAKPSCLVLSHLQSAIILLLLSSRILALCLLLTWVAAAVCQPLII